MAARLTRTLRAGFTLIEVMIVVAIIGVLAAIAIPRFADLMRSSNEGASKGNLGAVRSALNIYYGDLEGNYPAQLLALTVSSKYLSTIPSAKIPDYHPDDSAETDGPPSTAIDAGGWGYDNTLGDAFVGRVFVSCTHTDTKGSVWSTY